MDIRRILMFVLAALMLPSIVLNPFLLVLLICCCPAVLIAMCCSKPFFKSREREKFMRD